MNNIQPKSIPGTHISRMSKLQQASHRDSGLAPSTSKDNRTRTNTQVPMPKYNRATNLRLYKKAVIDKPKIDEEKVNNVQELKKEVNNDPKPTPSTIHLLKKALSLRPESKINIGSIPRCVSPIRYEDMPQTAPCLSRYRVKPSSETKCYIVHVSKPCLRMPDSETVKTQFINLNTETMRISPQNSIRPEENEVELNNTNYHFHVTPILETSKSSNLRNTLVIIILVLMTILSFVIAVNHSNKHKANVFMEVELTKQLYTDEYGLLRTKSDIWE